MTESTRTGHWSCRYRVSVLAAAISALAGSMANTASGQEQEEIEEITVTGTRIQQTSGFTTPIPVTSLSTDELSSFEPGNTVAEQLEYLPQFIGNDSAQSTETALVAGSGSSNLNLRDLGSNRTLVLLDGSRMAPSDMNGAVNIDTFPMALVQSVDVVTGGASAAYGADAVGGVVNFVLDREFEGLVVNGGGGVSEQGDGERGNFSIAGGTQIGDRLNFIGGAEIRQIQQVNRLAEDMDRSWWQNWGHVRNPDWSPGAPPGTPQRITVPWVSSTTFSPYGMIWANGRGVMEGFSLNGHVFREDGSSTRPFVKGDVYVPPTAPGSLRTQSGGPEGQIFSKAFQTGVQGSQVKARSIFAGLQYELSDTMTLFGQAMVGRQESNGYDLRESSLLPILASLWSGTIFRENAFLPDNVSAAMDEAGLESIGFYQRGQFADWDEKGGFNTLTGKERYTTSSYTVGIDMLLPNGWDLRASWQTGESDNKSSAYGINRVDRLFMAMDAVRDPDTGEIVCNVQLHDPTPEELANAPVVQGRLSPPTINTDNEQPLLSPVGLDNAIRDCVPINVMALGTDGISDRAREYLSTPRSEVSVVEQDFAEVLMTGSLFQGWSGPVSFATGLTWRDQNFYQDIESAVRNLGPALNAPELGIRGIPFGFLGGSETLHQFSSARPVDGDTEVWEWFGELNVPLWESSSGDQRLTSSLAYRSSDYDRSGRIESWKLGLDFQVLPSVRFRATKSADVREPTFSELFNNRGGGGGTIRDPERDDESYTVTVPSGGNPELRPEEAETLTAGLVLQPDFLPGLQISADWYDVEISDAVGTLGAQRIVDDCFATGDPQLCNRIERAASGIITKVSNVRLNVDQAKVQGVDVELSYLAEPNFFEDQLETFSIRGLAGFINERSDTPLGGVKEDIAGQLGTPDLTAVVTLDYSLGPYGIQFQQRHIDSTVLDVDWTEGVDVDDNTVASGNYTNMRLSYNGETNTGGMWNVAFNVINLFDREPPIVADDGGQEIPRAGGYDIFGRRFQVSGRLSF